MIKIENLSYQKIIKNLSYEFKENNHYLINGLNGSGKTTLINLIMNNYCNYKGDIFISKNYKLGFSPQNFHFLKNVTIKKQLELISSKNNVIVKKIEENTNLNLNKYEHQFSGGEKQLIRTLFFLYQNYDIYILDEPFNNLSSSKSEIIINELKKKKNVILIDHQNLYKGITIQLELREGCLYE